MTDKTVKIVIIILIIIMTLLLVVGGIMFIFTDVFKSSEDLFKKYIAQDIKNVYDTIEISGEENIINILGESNYTESFTGNIKYIENENDQEETYIINENGIVNNTKKESNRNIEAKYNDNLLLSIEQLKKEDIYGLRVSNLVQQFLSVENASFSYFVSSLGYNGQYFSEKMNFDNAKLDDIFVFSNEEIETLTKEYNKIIFTDLSSKNFSTKNNAMITLNNGQSVTTNSYTLTLTKNDIDKIMKRFLNQAMSDEIILAKIDKIDNKIKEMGFNQLEGESLREKYITYVKNKYDSIEYQGTDNTQIIITVYQLKGDTVRILIKTQTNEYTIDTLKKDNTIECSLKNTIYTNEGTDIITYSIEKQKTEFGYKKIFKYNSSNKNFEIEVESSNKEEGIYLNSNIQYKSDKVSNITAKTEYIAVMETQEVNTYFNENNSILLNSYDGNRIKEITKYLKNRVISSLENTRSNLNTKLLNNIMVWIDKREQKIIEDEKNNIEIQKQKFNNKFLLYEGTDVNYKHVKRLLQAVSTNLQDYQIVNGKQIRLLIQDGVENKEKVDELDSVITDKYKYNIIINKSNEGYVNAIDIQISKKNT